MGGRERRVGHCGEAGGEGILPGAEAIWAAGLGWEETFAGRIGGVVHRGAEGVKLWSQNDRVRCNSANGTHAPLVRACIFWEAVSLLCLP